MTTTSEIITNFEAEQKNVVFSALSEYLSTGLFVDVSLVCKGQILRAHKVVLSSSSKYFRDFFRHQPAVSIVDLDKELEPNDLNLTLEDIKLIIGILYCVGTVEISPLRIESLLVCAQVLGIPTLILFLKRIRESINDTKIVKDGNLLYYGGKVLVPSTSRFDLTNVSPRLSSHRRPSGGEMMYMISPSRQIFPPPQAPQSFPLNPPPPPPNPPPPLSVQQGDDRQTSTRQGGFPLLDLSLVKPMTASCVNSPESPAENNQTGWGSSGTPSPVPGPSGINTRPTATLLPSRPDSTPQPGPSSGVRDSMLNQQSKRQLTMRRSVSRISNASYSSLSLNCLQSPRHSQSRGSDLQDGQQPRRMNSVSMLDGIDPNLLMQLNNLQANQLDDLENVLLPHLTSDGRSCQPSPHGGNLLDLPGMELADSHEQERQENDQRKEQQSQDSLSSAPHSSTATSLSVSDNLAVVSHTFSSPSCTASNSLVSTNPVLTTNIQTSMIRSLDQTYSNSRIDSSTPVCLDLSRPQNSQLTEQRHDEPPTMTLRPPSTLLSSQRSPNTGLQSNLHQVSHTRDLSPQTPSKRPRFLESTDSASSHTPLPGVRLTPFTIYDQSLNKPVRLTPMGSVTLSPLKNLLAPSALTPDLNTSAAINNSENQDNETDSAQSNTNNDSNSNPESMTGLLNVTLDNSFDQSNHIVDDSDHLPEQLNDSLSEPAQFCENTEEDRSVFNSVETHKDDNLKINSGQNGSNANASQVNAQSQQGVIPFRLQEASTISLAPLASNPVPGSSVQPSQPLGEITMNLDQVCSMGKRMKFSVPGVSQAVTLNFSAEALQEMKNAALRTGRSLSQNAALPLQGGLSAEIAQDQANEYIDNSNQSEEISSSRGNFEHGDLDEEDTSPIEPENEQDEVDVEPSVDQDQHTLENTKKQKKSRKNLRQKLKSNRTSKKSSANKDVKYSCTVCDKSFAQEQQLIKHLRSHVKKIFSCETCCKVFDDRWKYDKHMEEVHNKKEIHNCPECESVFYQATELMAHIHACHPEKKNLECKICHISFNRKHQLIKHVTTWHPNSDIPICMICMELFDTKELQDQHFCSGAQVRSNKIVCHKHPSPLEFASKGELEVHMKTKHDASYKEFQISCYICQKTFLLRNNLWRHLRNIHNLETGGNIKKKEFTCNKCGKKFYYKNDLTNHEDVHNTEKKYKCGTCDRAFISNAKATRHARECQQEFICQLCGTHLSSSAKLRTHALTHSDDKPFSCSFCSCRFKEKRTLINHVKKKHERESPGGVTIAESGIHDEPEVGTADDFNTTNTADYGNDTSAATAAVGGNITDAADYGNTTTGADCNNATTVADDTNTYSNITGDNDINETTRADVVNTTAEANYE